MKATDKKDLQTKSVKDLQKQIAEAKKELAHLKLDHVQNKLKNTRSIFNTRKTIAVMESILQVRSKTEIKEEKNG